MVGMLAVSRAGHDSATTYVIIEEDSEYVYLADGRIRTVDRPKKKNRKHIQVVKKVQMEKPDDGFKDLEIRKAIKKYQEEANVKS
ncbi:MAG: KOW domain-containing RNA-binding protein [Eubacterium sp.]|nr:KOW domain-containing RNA-binding protein [Eubacterium sp.]